MRQVPTRKGLELSRLTNGREGWLAGVGMRPGHTEEGVRLRESLPLPNISQMLSEQLPCPARPPRGTQGKVKYYVKPTFASYCFQHGWVLKTLV